MIRLAAMHFYMSICIQPTIENYTDNWNAHDAYIYQQSIKECGRVYLLKTCMNRFRKYDENVYSFTCVEPKE